MTIRIGQEVSEALAAGRPVLALESTIITHGLPRPRNQQVALEAEDLVRSKGVVPATIGIVDGVAVVGLSRDEIVHLADSTDVVKASTRDLPMVAMNGLSAGTTVAATTHLAHVAGIKVFSTGGLGGVHRGASASFDESADLSELAITPIVLVSAGVKSVLDIPATLERLETMGIPVLGYRTNKYPGFYVSDSGYTIDYVVNSPEDIAAAAAHRDDFALRSALLVANPIAQDRQLDPQLHSEVLAEALAECDARGIHGHDITPFLLDYIQQRTGGRSLDVNVDVYNGNVALGCEIASAIAARG